MKNLIAVLFIINACLSQDLKTIATTPFNINWEQKVTDVVLEKTYGAPDTMNILQKIDNVDYIYSNKMNCHFIIQDGDFILYSIEMIDGDCHGLKTGMSKRKVIKYLGEPYEKIISKNGDIMDWNYGDKYTVTIKFSKGRLQSLIINKNI